MAKRSIILLLICVVIIALAASCHSESESDKERRKIWNDVIADLEPTAPYSNDLVFGSVGVIDLQKAAFADFVEAVNAEMVLKGRWPAMEAEDIDELKTRQGRLIKLGVTRAMALNGGLFAVILPPEADEAQVRAALDNKFARFKNLLMPVPDFMNDNVAVQEEVLQYEFDIEYPDPKPLNPYLKEGLSALKPAAINLVAVRKRPEEAHLGWEAQSRVLGLDISKVDGFRELLSSLEDILGLPDDLKLNRPELVDDLQWVAIGVDLWPTPALEMVIETMNKPAAERVMNTMAQLTAFIRKQATASGLEAGDANRLFGALVVNIEGSQVKLSLRAEQPEERLAATRLVAAVLQHIRVQQALWQARQLAMRIQSISSGAPQNPASYEELSRMQGGGYLRKLFKSPLAPQLDPGFIYLKPNQKIGTSRELMLYSAHEKFGEGVVVAYSNANVEYITDEKRFRGLLTAAGHQYPPAPDEPSGKPD